MRKVYLLILLILSLCVFTACSNSTVEDTKDTSEETSSVAMDNESDKDNILIAYFSYTGNTKKVAEYIHEKYNNSTLFEIIPEIPYTQEDTDYDNTDNRARQELADDSSRPKIKDSVEDMDQYTYVFLGYPIWYGEAPRIIDTFLDSYDLSGKTIIPFCTSTSSPLGESAENLEGLAPNSNWINGIRFESEVSQETVDNWLNTLEVK